MLKFLRIGLAALIVSALIPASAQAINIGLLGDGVDPPVPLTNITFQALAADGCLLDDVFCAIYSVENDIYDPQVFSIDFRILNSDSQYFTTADIGETLFASEDSDLQTLVASTLFTDGFTLTLSGFVEDFEFPFFVDCDPAPSDCRADFFSDSSQVTSVSVVGVNGIANPGATAVPEPASLLLFGTGIAGLAAYRRRTVGKARG